MATHIRHPQALELGLLAWTILFGVRIYKNDSTVWFDAFVLLVAQSWTLLSSWTQAGEAAVIHASKHLVLLHMLSTVSIGLFRRLIRSRRRLFPMQMPADIGPLEMKPLVWPCRTTHTRLYPKKHSFAYSYLLVGVPVDWTGSSGSLLSSGSSTKTALFHVDAADHLDRDSVHSSLRQKLDTYLARMESDPALYPYAYLVTAPRCMGYCFNPVSFWYLYARNRELTAMILEVNNTFDERRMYFLKNGDGRKDGTFSTTWQKDFHVSPFNDREGSYILKAADPRPFDGESIGVVSNDITLQAADGRPKLVARVSAVSHPLGQWPVGFGAQTKFLSTWIWVGLATFPRIVWEAGKLYFRHALVVWFRPEVAPSSIGRQATAEER